MTMRPHLLPLAFLLSGCAVKSTVAVMQTEQAIAAAQQAGADEGAVHDITLARAYLEQAQEEWSHSQYADADRLAAEGLKYAQSAQQKAAIPSDQGSAVPEDVQTAPPPVEQPTAEPDDTELQQLIQQDGTPAPTATPPAPDDDKLDTEIFKDDQ